MSEDELHTRPKKIISRKNFTERSGSPRDSTSSPISPLHKAFSGKKLLKLGKPPPGSVLSLISLWTVLIHVVIITINASCARTARINTCALPLRIPD
jgi:hypothetical protein